MSSGKVKGFAALLGAGGIGLMLLDQNSNKQRKQYKPIAPLPVAPEPLALLPSASSRAHRIFFEEDSFRVKRRIGASS
ncbi:hypothetical protein DIPPA_13725 [Diplonema papillatum]|nr:hypothetical protein DIPPA_13725 [Diplonema papillatum]